MQMYVGAALTGNTPSSIASLPSPGSPEVTLTVSGGEAVAVLKFEGYITPASAEAARQKLVAALQQGTYAVIVCMYHGQCTKLFLHCYVICCADAVDHIT